METKIIEVPDKLDQIAIDQLMKLSKRELIDQIHAQSTRYVAAWHRADVAMEDADRANVAIDEVERDLEREKDQHEITKRRAIRESDYLEQARRMLEAVIEGW